MRKCFRCGGWAQSLLGHVCQPPLPASERARTAHLLLENDTNGKNFFFWIGATAATGELTCFKQVAARHMFILGKPRDEMLVIKSALVALGFQVTGEIVDHPNEESYEF